MLVRVVFSVTVSSVFLAGVVATAGQPRPQVYLPLDQATPLTIGMGEAAVGLPSRQGVRAEAVYIDQDVRLRTDRQFRVEQGTVAFWVRPQWPIDETVAHYLFCLYGHNSVNESWQHNRWTVRASDGRLHFDIYGAIATQRAHLNAPITSWKRGQWHHVAVTWTGINGSESDAHLCLYLDGQLRAEQKHLRLDVGPIDSTFAIGRDCDGSPDYALADFDEFYILDAAVTQQQIQQAVALAQQPQEPRVVTPSSARPRGDWWDPRWPLRTRVRVGPLHEAVEAAAVHLAFDFDRDLPPLRYSAAVDRSSLRVVPVDESGSGGANDAAPLAVEQSPDALRWSIGPRLEAGQSRVYDVYFGQVEFDASIPLFVRRRQIDWPRPAQGEVTINDYASDTYQDAWDFDEEDEEAIDSWGSKAEYNRNRRVAGGVLRYDAHHDAYLIWGDMWGDGTHSKRPVAIDLEQYPVLRMRVRQSCRRSTWELFGRGETARLLNYKFDVQGQGWQTIRIDLVRQAGWGGTLKAFRIDTSSWINDVRIEVDWVRLSKEVSATRRTVELLPQVPGTIARLTLDVADATPVVGTQQVIAATAFGSNGRPVANYPFTFRLSTEGGGTLLDAPDSTSLGDGPRLRRALSDGRGRVSVALQASTQAGESIDRLEATADFASDSARIAAHFSTRPGPADHYRVWPLQAVFVPQDEPYVPIRAQLVDAYNNPLQVADQRVTLSAPTGTTIEPSQGRSDARGRLDARLSFMPGERRVASVAVRDEAGRQGQSARICLVARPPRPRRIGLLPNGYFADQQGKAFVPLGGFYANWVQCPTPDGEWAELRSFTDTSDEYKRRWLAYLHQNGVTAIRMMLRTHRADGMEPMDLCGRLNRSLMGEVARYLDIAREFDLQFQLVIHEDYTKPAYHNAKHLRQYVLPAYADENLDELPPAQRRFVRDQRLITPVDKKYNDPDALACQDQYVEQLVPLLRTNPQVFAYELENEMVDCPAAWANHAVGALHQLDPDTPVCASHGGGGLRTADPLWWHQRTNIDFYNYHLYPHGRTTTSELDYGAAVSLLARYGQMCGPCFMGESAGDQFRHHKDSKLRRWVMRDIIWMALTSGSPGVYFWNARGAEVQEFLPARQAMEQLSLTTFRRARPEIGIDVRHPLDDDKWFRTPQGERAQAMMGRYVQHYLSRGVDFDFTAKPDLYQRTCNLNEFAPPEPAQQRFEIPTGWQLSYLANQDHSEVLVYIRNMAGIAPWEVDMGRSVWRQFLRQRAERPLAVQLRLPQRRYQLTIRDLDEQTPGKRDMQQRWVNGNERLEFGDTDHDFSLVLRRDAAP